VALDGKKAKVAADLGPVKYLATLPGAGDQDVLRYFILLVALLLDPAAVLLLLADSVGAAVANSSTPFLPCTARCTALCCRHDA
jgi:hypothetical protein